MNFDKSLQALLERIEMMIVCQKIIGGEHDGPIVVISNDGPPWVAAGRGDQACYPILRQAMESKDPELIRIVEIAGRAIRNRVLNGDSATAHAG